MTNEKQNTCANCAKKFTVSEENKAYRPFCCKRCQLADLGQWLQEKYVVEGEHSTEVSENNDDTE